MIGVILDYYGDGLTINEWLQRGSKLFSISMARIYLCMLGVIRTSDLFLYLIMSHSFIQAGIDCPTEFEVQVSKGSPKICSIEFEVHYQMIPSIQLTIHVFMGGEHHHAFLLSSTTILKYPTIRHSLTHRACNDDDDDDDVFIKHHGLTLWVAR